MGQVDRTRVGDGENGPLTLLDSHTALSLCSDKTRLPGAPAFSLHSRGDIPTVLQFWSRLQVSLTLLWLNFRPLLMSG